MDASATSHSTTLEWDSATRCARVTYALGASLVATDGPFLVDALTGWVGDAGEPFALLVDGAGLRGTDAAYRTAAHRFFQAHRASAFIALLHLRPVIQVVVEMFRIGAGVQLKTFGDEVSARAWLRSKGIRA